MFVVRATKSTMEPCVARAHSLTTKRHVNAIKREHTHTAEFVYKKLFILFLLNKRKDSFRRSGLFPLVIGLSVDLSLLSLSSLNRQCQSFIFFLLLFWISRHFTRFFISKIFQICQTAKTSNRHLFQFIYNLTSGIRFEFKRLKRHFFVALVIHSPQRCVGVLHHGQLVYFFAIQRMLAGRTDSAISPSLWSNSNRFGTLRSANGCTTLNAANYWTFLRK